MSIRTALALVATLALAGCSATREDAAAAAGASSDGTAEPSAAAELPGAPSSEELVAKTIVKGEVIIGETSKVGYHPELYREAEIDGVPYLAWELVAPARPALKTQAGGLDTRTISVGVVGNFPSEPDVLIVNDDFVVIGQTRASATALGDEATLTVDASKGARFVLVRDMHWVAPMDFDIRVTR